MVDARSGRRVWVALCTYNGAPFVRAQLDSIARQTRLPDALIVVDDGSSDGTAEVVGEFAARAPFPVQLEINPATLGTAANFERAIRRCGEGVIFLADQDDIWRDDKIERMVQALEAEPGALLVHSDARIVDEALGDLGETLSAALSLAPAETAGGSPEQKFAALLRRNFVTGCTAALDSKLLRWALPFPPDWLHDEWLAVIAAAAGGIAWVGEPLVLYRQHPANQLGVTRHRGLSRIGWLLAGRGGVRSRFVPRLVQLLDRIRAMQSEARPGAEALVTEALAFAQFRSALPPNRRARIGPVLRQWRSGAYGRYGRGLRTVLVDLVEAIPPADGG